MCSTKILLATIFNEIKCHVNISLGLVGGVHPLCPRLMTSKSRERTHEVSIDNMANEDSLLSVIWDLLKVLIRFGLLKLLSALRWQQYWGSLV